MFSQELSKSDRKKVVLKEWEEIKNSISLIQKREVKLQFSEADTRAVLIDPLM